MKISYSFPFNHHILSYSIIFYHILWHSIIFYDILWYSHHKEWSLQSICPWTSMSPSFAKDLTGPLSGRSEAQYRDDLGAGKTLGKSTRNGGLHPVDVLDIQKFLFNHVNPFHIYFQWIIFATICHMIFTKHGENAGFHKWGYPQSSILDRDFPYKPSSDYGVVPPWRAGNPQKISQKISQWSVGNPHGFPKFPSTPSTDPLLTLWMAHGYGIDGPWLVR